MGETSGGLRSWVRRMLGSGESAPDPSDPSGFEGTRELSAEGTDPSLEATLDSGSGPGGAPAPALPRDPVFGKYRLVRLLGEGGMGRVYEAHDPQLDRRVALKVMARTTPEGEGRFLAEARAQAKVDHPHVCKIFEVGRVDGVPYIAMQRIRGQDLEKLQDALSLEEKVLVIRQVADAVHEAHRVGLIHRDLKPSNVMVEQDELGRRVPYVMDFGLARHQGTEGQTLAGHVVGTPAYMAPEQIHSGSQAVDRRSDVYGLGATLHKALTGFPPFEADSLAGLLAKVLQEEPPSLQARAPWIPTDLDVIVRKCLEKSPGARYASARALAEDLQRYLDGEPILARPVGWSGRMLRRARKHKELVAAVGAVALLMAGVAGWALRGQWRLRRQAQSAQRFGLEAERLEGFLRQARLLPAHDLRPELAHVQGRLAALEAEAARLDPIARGPALAAQGRVHLALGRPDLARRCLEQARADGYAGPDTAMALGQALAARYEQGLQEARRVASRSQRQAREEELARSLREPALALLQSGREGGLEVPELLSARIALVQGRYAEAESLAGALRRREPWRVEALALQAEARCAAADRDQEEGRYAEAWAGLDAAAAVLAEARAAARSDERLALREAELLNARWWVDQRRGGPGGPWDARALEAADRALALWPDAPEAWALKGELLRTTAVRLDASSPERRARAGEAVDCARKSLALAEGRGDGPESLADFWTRLGHTLAQRAAADQATGGGDPAGSYAEAQGALERAQALAPGLAGTHTALADFLADLGSYEESRGRDPLPTWTRAAAAYERALELRPRNLSLLNNLGYVLKDMGRHLLLAGEDPDPTFLRAETCYRRTVELDPAYAFGWNNLSVLAGYRARARMLRGEDPTALAEEGLARSGRALAINARDGHFFLARMEHHLWKARWAMASGGDPRPAFEAAVLDLDQGTALRPQELYTYYCATVLELVQARWALDQGRSAALPLQRALDAVGRGLPLNPSSADLLLLRAQVRMMRFRTGRDPRELRAAEEDLQKVGALGDFGEDVRLLKAECARQARLAGRPADLEAALAEVARVLARRPRRAEALALRGALRLLARPGAPEARADLEAALARNPKEEGELLALPPHLASGLLKGL